MLQTKAIVSTIGILLRESKEGYLMHCKRKRIKGELVNRI